MSFDEWARRVYEKEEAMKANSRSAPPTSFAESEVNAFLVWLGLETMLNEIGITQKGESDD